MESGPKNSKSRKTSKNLNVYIDIPASDGNQYQPLFISAMSRLPQRIKSGRFQGNAKRFLDIVGASLGLLALSPILIIIMTLIKLTSRGPSIFSQSRVGRGGKIFKIYKFRTMYQDSEARLSGLMSMNEQDGPAFKIRNDPRVTPFGRILRKYSMDELPQLWNIIKGEMSLVGPRPALISETKGWPAEYYKRLSVQQGLTCIWQVSGRSDVSFDQWVEMDIKYVESWTFFLDLKLILQTLKVVAKGQGAY